MIGDHLVLVEKLHERLHYERNTVRLCDALLGKHEGHHEGLPARAELEALRDDEKRHVTILDRALRATDSPPPVSVDVGAAVAEALLSAMRDPRTSFATGLELLLMVELADDDAWDTLVDLAESVRDPLAEELRGARDDERRHVARLRTWSRATLRAREGQVVTGDEDLLSDQAAGAAASSLLPI